MYHLVAEIVTNKESSFRQVLRILSPSDTTENIIPPYLPLPMFKWYLQYYFYLTEIGTINFLLGLKNIYHLLCSMYDLILKIWAGISGFLRILRIQKAGKVKSLLITLNEWVNKKYIHSLPYARHFYVLISLSTIEKSIFKN